MVSKEYFLELDKLEQLNIMKEQIECFEIIHPPFSSFSQQIFYHQGKNSKKIEYNGYGLLFPSADLLYISYLFKLDYRWKKTPLIKLLSSENMDDIEERKQFEKQFIGSFNAKELYDLLQKLIEFRLEDIKLKTYINEAYLRSNKISQNTEHQNIMNESLDSFSYLLEKNKQQELINQQEKLNNIFITSQTQSFIERHILPPTINLDYIISI